MGLPTRASCGLVPTLCLVLLASCSVPSLPSGSTAQAPGSAALSVLLPRGVSASRVTITASAPGITPSYLQLSYSNGLWSGLLEHLPSGANRSFLAQVYDASNTLIYEGTTSGISVPPRQMTLVLVTVHAVDSPPPPPVGQAPHIVSAVQNGTRVVDRPIVFQVIAEDPQGGALTFAWAVNVGTLDTARSNATASSISWIAPDCSNETLDLIATVRNGLGLAALQHFSVQGLIPCHGSATGAMTTPRSLHTATLLRNGQVLVTGSQELNEAAAAPEVYDPVSGTWRPTGSMVIPRRFHTATLLPDGRVLVTGGCDLEGFCPLASELYEPASGTWSATGSMAMPRLAPTATLLPDGRVLVAGGSFLTEPLSTAEVYDPASGTWSLTSPMAFSHENHTATLLLDGQVLVAGGFVASTGDDSVLPQMMTEVYDPASNLWSPAGRLIIAHAGHSATRLPNGKVLLTGGADNLELVELYDPTTRAWHRAMDMNTPHGGHTATLLPNGQVLVAGGIYDREVELYDPASDTWSQTSPLTSRRSSHQATLLLDGRVLISGGRESSGDLATAELYTP